MENVSELPIFIENKPLAQVGEPVLFKDKIYVIQKIKTRTYSQEYREIATKQVKRFRELEKDPNIQSDSYWYEYILNDGQIVTNANLVSIGFESVNTSLKARAERLEKLQEMIFEINRIIEE